MLWRSDRTWRRDGVVIAVGFALCLLGGVLQVDDTLAPPSVAAYVIALVSSAVTVARHRAPVVTLVATTVCGMLVTPFGLLLSPLTVAPAVISSYSLSVHGERRVVTALLPALVLLLVAPVPFLESAFSWADVFRLVTVAAAPLVAAVVGRLTRHRRAHLAFMEERARRAEETRESEARRKVTEERVRIARELHDLVAHQITLANAQAMVAAHLLATDPDQARTNLDELVKTTRQALDELRATVGLLRERDDPATSIEPMPGLSQLADLVETFRAAGLDVVVRHQGAAVPLSPPTDLAAYRIIQEALTNVTKHAGSRAAEVDLLWGRDRVTITVADGGGPRRTPERPPGYGLIGLRERAAAVGGDLTAQSRPEGGFLVAARLPVPDTETDTESEGR